MPTTIGQTTIDTATIIEHAIRRCGIPVEKQTPDTIQLARDNLFFLFTSFANRGLPLWCVEEVSIPLVAGTKSYTCPDGTIDILNLNLRQTIGATYTDRVLPRISRDQYFALPNKDVQGVPLQYWYDRQLEPVITLWPVPNDTTYTLRLVRQRQIADVGGLTETLDIPTRWIEATIWQLAKRIVMSLPGLDPTTIQRVTQMAAENQIEVESEDVDNSPVMLQPNISVYTT
jgi:hypothetical protein